MHIFCDESGFTGNKLLDSEQDVFSYASVAISPDAAAELVAKVRMDHRLQGKELKGSVLLKQERGRYAIEEILKSCQGNFRVVPHLKPYALTSKLFEYIFEPAVSNFNSFLYEINFHRFIATLPFAHLRVQDKSAEVLLDDFVRFAHKGDISALEAIFPPSASGNYSDSPLYTVGLFAQLHKNEIAEEVLSFREPGIPNWILDLTTTSLFGLLGWWGERYDQLEVICDESKPLQGDMPAFETMIGRTEKMSINFQGIDRPATFNLKSQIKLLRSEGQPGIQIADVIAATTSKLFSNKFRELSSPDDKTWASLLDEHVHSGIWPDLANADISTPGCFANTVVLHELIKRSLSRTDLFTGLPAIAAIAYRSHGQFMKDMKLQDSSSGRKTGRGAQSPRKDIAR